MDQEASCLIAVADYPAGPEGSSPRPDMVVNAVMLRRPKTLSAHASIQETRAALANDHVHMVLLTDGRALVGTMVRADLPGAETGAGPAIPWAKLAGRTVPPDARADIVQHLLVERGLRRVAVIDAEGELLGLVCLKRRRTGFCSDADIASRAWDSRTPPRTP